MPKAPRVPKFPLEGLVGIEKPSGPPSMVVIDSLKPLFCSSRFFLPAYTSNASTSAAKVKEETRKLMKRKGGLKIGQGGTLDPLADGVLVLGIGKGTKDLGGFLDCTKSYTSIGLLGACTTSYDSEGEVITTAPYAHVTREMIEGVLDKFRGNIYQTPPIYSAIKMDGKPLYDYARSNTPLPRPIPARAVTISHLSLINFTPAQVVPGDGGHTYEMPAKQLNDEEKEVFERLTRMSKEAGIVDEKGERVDEKVPEGTAVLPEEGGKKPKEEGEAVKKEEVVGETAEAGTAGTVIKPATFEVRMTVTSGTYVRSIIHDIGLAIGSAAHVVKLTRTRQGQFALDGEEEEPSTAAESATKEGEDAHFIYDEHGPDRFDFGERKTGCIPWKVFEKAIAEQKAEERAEKDKIQVKKAAPPVEMDEEEAMNAMMNGESLAPEPEKQEKWIPKEWERELWARFVVKD